MRSLAFVEPVELPAADVLRAEVREFLAAEHSGPGSYAYLGGDDASFSRKLGARGWIGMCWPRRYGGSERTIIERYVVAEEMLAARAPLAAHWIGDRQAGPLLLRYGTEAQRQAILPRIAAGECRFCIGMSEADSGSDLASVKTRARPADGGFVLTGAKLWTSAADRSDYMIVLCRTSPRTEARHEGLTQLLVDMRLPGITVRPIRNMAGEADFNEVVFDEVRLPADALVGTVGNGWEQVNSELAFERAGPERFLSSFGLLVELIALIGSNPSRDQAIALGRLVAHLAIVRQLSRSVATAQHLGDLAATQAAMVKDLGTNLEQTIADVARALVDDEPDLGRGDGFAHALAEVLIHAPSFTIRGGTREILRGIIARGIGLR